MDILKVENLSKKYKNTPIVNKVSFSVKEGEIFGFLGPNGAGKSTTIRMIMGIEEVTSGKIILDGEDDITNKGPESRVSIGVQLQTSDFYDNLTVLETLKLFLRLNNRIENLDYHIELTHIGHLLHKKVGVLSGGEKQRLSLTLTLANDPRLIILDEPTTGLDPQARQDLWDIILKLKELGKSIIITTHFMDEAEILCDRVGIINNGEMLCIDTVGNLLNRLEYKYKIYIKAANKINKSIVLNIPEANIMDAQDNELHFYTNNSTSACVEIMNALKESNNEIIEIKIVPFNLNDVFFCIAGRGLH